MTITLLSLILLHLALPLPEEYAGTEIIIDNIDLSLGGNIKIQVFNELAVTSDRMVPILEKTIAANGDKSPITLAQLSTGKYMIAIMHDCNGNGKMDYSFFGVPKEGYAFSGQFSCGLKSAGPKFHMIKLNEGLQQVRMHLCY
ncbi:DUF2141 domain-containing protein [Echinicola vietnamensis]|uniref:DUF2141 domain-containing protein n=1 Tax=Echinicola vietnamensis (strain DSM 17526 / LMG 23754 / KMM 6221) TaxID=926556 RepID=L0G047_ECHVK|nr:DUF2141 domain-containing protein [Echinicola vietnamensis]AGA78927.1 hypothetical protein Echvi_2687 [Echinicola vietnamensis DSM 17526]